MSQHAARAPDACTFSSYPMMPTSAQPRLVSLTPAPEMLAVLNPICSTRRTLKPSYTPGQTMMPGSAIRSRRRRPGERRFWVVMRWLPFPGSVDAPAMGVNEASGADVTDEFGWRPVAPLRAQTFLGRHQMPTVMDIQPVTVRPMFMHTA